MATRVVTDSTSDLPQSVAQELGIVVVPLNVHFGEQQSYKDGVELTADDFYDRLVSSPELPRTSQPSIGDFVDTYREVAEGADGIVSVHISEKLSGTLNSARQAASEIGETCPVELVDTGQASMGLGMAAIQAAEAASRGASLKEVAEVARESAARCQCIAMMDTLEFLEKGGRVGKAQALVGSLLRIKPMIIVRDGEVHPLDKPRTYAKALARLEHHARSFVPVERICILYSTTPEPAVELAERLADLLPDGGQAIMSRFGPVIGTHVGPGALGIGLLQSART